MAVNKTADDIARVKYLEALQLPKFKQALDRLLDRKSFDFILDCQSVTQGNLPRFVDKAIIEGNAILIQREYCGYMVILWRD